MPRAAYYPNTPSPFPMILLEYFFTIIRTSADFPNSSSSQLHCASPARLSGKSLVGLYQPTISLGFDSLPWHICPNHPGNSVSNKMIYLSSLRTDHLGGINAVASRRGSLLLSKKSRKAQQIPFH